ncbi:hypothetical protein K525DRAFT_209089 [Schizophyllum commune Loenen D]|nr:hypothetical protein K525DRAFT_209089 [Schizophyllum commune Loenen D]
MTEDERLPQELKEAILHQLYAAGDIQSLVTCALAHRSLYPVSQNYLFRDISLRGLLPATRLYRSLKENPRLLSYVRVLYVEDSAEEWTAGSHELVEVLSDARHIQELHFYSSPIAYDMLPSGLRDALLRTIALPSMRVLTLAYIMELPWSVFLRASHIRDLRLRNVVSDELEEAPDWSSPPIQLYGLALHVPGNFYDNFVQCLRQGYGQIYSVDQLRSLSLCMYAIRWQVGIPDIIAPCANTLQSLELGCSVSDFLVAADEPSDFDLDISLPHLRLLALHDVAVMHLDPRHWVWLSRLLAGAPNVTHIAVKVQRPIPRLFCLVGLISRLSNVLVGNSAPTTLKSFRVVVPSSPYSSYDFDQLDIEDMDWALGILRSNAVDVKITRSLSHGIVQPPLLSLDLLDE